MTLLLFLFLKYTAVEVFIINLQHLLFFWTLNANAPMASIIQLQWIQFWFLRVDNEKN